MSAEVLQKAAALMRTRADRTTPGPWFIPGPNDEYVGPADVVGDGIPGERYVICEHAGMDAIHIASWHPLVALAVADWLWKVADWDERGIRGEDWDDAIAVATAYLGARP